MPRTSSRKRTPSDASNASTVLGDVADVAEEPIIETCARAEPPEARRSDPIADAEVDAVYEELYSQMESEAMLEIMADLERELVPAYLSGSLTGTGGGAAASSEGEGSRGPDARASESKKHATEQLLWHITATPSMMRDLAASVRSGGGASAAVVSVSG